MSYRIEFHQSAQKELAALPRKIQRRMDTKIQGLADNPRPPAAKPIQGKLKGLYRVRVGDYRIIYQVLKRRVVVYIVRIRDRKDAYK